MLAEQGLPLDDWQFWAVTLLAIAAAAAIVRPLLPKSRRGKASCRGCPSGDSEQGSDGSPRPRRVELTVGGRRIRP